MTVTSLEDALGLLSDCVLFRKLAPHERNELVARAHMRRFEAGDTIFLMGALNNSMMAVLKGEVKISVTSAEGKEIMLAIVHAGEVFGEIAMLDGKPRSADAKALTTCDLAIVDRRDVLAALERTPAAWSGLVEVLCSRMRRTDQHLVEVAFLELPTRLANALLRIVDAERVKSADLAGTECHLSQAELATIVGAARESVNKYLHAWQRTGIVQIERRVIKIANRAALEALAGQGNAVAV
jgi:CRP/FNR family transcriptional regulator, cyclic AMP receptor protein